MHVSIIIITKFITNILMCVCVYSKAHYNEWLYIHCEYIRTVHVKEVANVDKSIAKFTHTHC